MPALYFRTARAGGSIPAGTRTTRVVHSFQPACRRRSAVGPRRPPRFPVMFRAGCDDFRRSLRPDRRSFVKAGLLGAAGLSLADVLRAQDHTTAGSRSRVNSVIILWMRGGPSHIDMWDPKPDAPAEYRGE